VTQSHYDVQPRSVVLLAQSLRASTDAARVGDS
jgi:hypothetical protein